MACLTVDYCFSEQAVYYNSAQHVGQVHGLIFASKRCKYHNIFEKLQTSHSLDS